jgi:hypothetical protein
MVFGLWKFIGEGMRCNCWILILRLDSFSFHLFEQSTLAFLELLDWVVELLVVDHHFTAGFLSSMVGSTAGK